MIFCIEDDSGIRDLMIYTLNASGFEAQGFADGNELFAALKTSRPQLILLDIMLPGEDGISILKRIRQNSLTADIPVIMATAKGTEYDRVIGLDSGADDYLCKPFGMMEMVSRVKAVLRRAAPAAVSVLQIGSLSIDTAAHTVISDGTPIELTLKEYELLKFFVENPDHVFTREQILSAIWGMDFLGETRTVDVHIGTLRTKLLSCGSYIETVRGVGYKLSLRAI